MRKIIAALFLLGATACSLPLPDVSQASCDGGPGLYHLSGPSRSLEDLELEGIAFAKQNPATPQVAFAKAHSNWLDLKAAYLPGDKIRASMTRGYKNQVHTTGYAISRDGCVVKNLVLTITD